MKPFTLLLFELIFIVCVAVVFWVVLSLLKAWIDADWIYETFFNH